MNTQSPEYKRVIHDIMSHLPTLDHDRDYDKSMKEELAEKILSIEGLAILADDQSLPRCRWECDLAQQDILKANFMKVVNNAKD